MFSCLRAEPLFKKQTLISSEQVLVLGAAGGLSESGKHCTPISSQGDSQPFTSGQPPIFWNHRRRNQQETTSLQKLKFTCLFHKNDMLRLCVCVTAQHMFTS